MKLLYINIPTTFYFLFAPYSFSMGSMDEPDDSALEAFQSVQSRIQHFSDSGQPLGSNGNNTGSPEYSPKSKKKQLPSSKAFELFESQGIVIGPVSMRGILVI